MRELAKEYARLVERDSVQTIESKLRELDRALCKQYDIPYLAGLYVGALNSILGRQKAARTRLNRLKGAAKRREKADG